MKSLLLGYDALKRPIPLNAEDRLIHMHVIGASGGGKSKFLESMIRGDLGNHQGFCLLDPHGDLYDDVLHYCARFPASVPRDIILLNLSAGDPVVGFNPFRRVGNSGVSVQVDNRIVATMHAWNTENSDTKPTLERTLRLIYTVLLEQNLGLPLAEHLIDFNARNIRAYLIERLKTPLIQKEWRELQQLQARDWRPEMLAAKNRLFRFLTSPTLMRFMGLPDRTLDLKTIMDEGKVLLVNLKPSDVLSDENASVFGALLVNEFFECAKRRPRDSRGRDPKPYYLYLDEFQNFVSLDIVKMLAQVRKRGLFMVLAHQYLEQLDERLCAAVLTNCSIKAVFGGLSAPSARMMAEELFIRKLDPTRIKVAMYQTKFWPKEETRQVRTQSRSHTSATGWTESSGTGSSGGSTTGEVFGAEQWFGSAMLTGRSVGDSLGTTVMSGRSSSGSEGLGDAESVAEIPVFVPVPFRELSSIQYYGVDEQLTEFTAALKEQYQRHCFIKILNHDAEPMLVPNVERFHVSERNRAWYEDKLLSQVGALTAAEVDGLLNEQDGALLEAVQASAPKATSSARETRAPNASQTPANQDSPWNRGGASDAASHLPHTPSLQSGGRARTGKKPGPKPDVSNHAKVAAVLAKYGDCWDTEENLPEVCEELDTIGVPPSPDWSTLKPPALRWVSACRVYRDRVVKAIVYRRDHAPGDET